MKTIYLDLDGVLANFFAGVGRPVEQHEDPPELYEKGFYRNLPVNEGAKEFVAELLKLKKYNVYIASKPVTRNFKQGKPAYCASEKYEWINEHFPELLRKTFLTCNKGLLKGHYLVDDHAHWAKEFEGHTFVFNPHKPKESFEEILKQLT